MGHAADRLFEEATRLSKPDERTVRFLEVLQEALELPEEDRRALALRLHATVSLARSKRHAVLPWDALRRARGIVQLGGDAVEDCERLYDG